MVRTNDSRRTVFISAAVFVLTLASFWPVVQNGFINFDDPEYVLENAHVSGGLSWANASWALTTGYAGNWHPLTWLSHMLDVQWFGLNPIGHHVSSLLLHAINGVLLFLVLQRMTGSPWRSALVAAIFAVHPLRVESVAWVSERKDVLSGFFFLLTLAAYRAYVVRSAAPGQSPAGEGTSGGTEVSRTKQSPGSAIGFYLLAILSYALGLMSKPMLVTLPFVLLLLDFWPLRRFSFPVAGTLSAERGNLRCCILDKAAFLALAIAVSVITIQVQSHQGAVSTIHGLPFVPRLSNAVASYLKYAMKVVWPADLAIFYPHPETTYPLSTQWPTWQILCAAAVLLLISVMALRMARSKPYLSVGWFWFTGMLIPVIGLVQVGSQAMADRYTYLPAIGLCLAIIWFVSDLLPDRRVVATGWLPISVVSCCCVLTWLQTRVWRDSLTLFEHTLRVTSENATAHFNLGAAFEAQGRLGQAMAQYRAALRIDPYYADAQYNIAHALGLQNKWEEAADQYRAVFGLNPDHVFAHNNLGNALLALGKSEEAKAEYREAMRLAADYAAPHNNLGKVLTDEGNLTEAAEQFRQALALQPDYVEARAGLALALAGLGRYEESLSHWQKAAALRAGNAEIHFNLGNVFTELHRTNEARAQFDLALKLNPDLANQNIRSAQALAAQGRLGAAEARFIAALRLNPENPECHGQFGRLLAQEGRLDEAIVHFQKAVQFEPSLQRHYDLAVAFVMAGKTGLAIAQYQHALELNPDYPAAMNDLAWILATHPDTTLRDGTRALSLARRACELGGQSQPRYWGTLDAAYAESGLFQEAIAAAEKTSRLALAAGLKDVAEAAQQRLVLYRNGRAFHQPAVSSSPPGSPQ